MTEPKFMTPAHRRAYLTHLNRCKAIPILSAISTRVFLRFVTAYPLA